MEEYQKISNCGETKITDLPVEMLMKVFSYVRLEELLNTIQNVCSVWNDVMHIPYIWNDVAFIPDSGMTEKEIIQFLKNVPQLRRFYMDVKNVTLNNVISALCELCPDIHSVYIESDQKTLLSHDLEMLVTSYPQLLAIAFAVHGTEVNRTVELLSRCNKLKTVLLRGWWWQELDESIFRTLIDNCSHIRRIHFGAVKSGVYIGNSDLHHLLELRGSQLVSLNFTCKSLTSGVIRLLGNCTTLRELHFGNLVNETEIDLTPLAHLTNLVSFSIEGFTDEGQSLYKLFSSVDWPQLQVLNISFLTILQENLTMESIFQNCKNIKHLSVKDIHADSMKNINKLSNLVSISLAGCRQMVDDGVDYISKCTGLKTIKLNDCKPLTDVSITYLTCCTELKHLELNHCWNIEGNTLYLIPEKLQKLRELSIVNCETVNEKALAQLKKDMPQLQIITDFWI